MHRVRALRPAQALHALGDRAARHENRPFSRLVELGDLRGPAGDRGRVQAASLVGDERRADLHDQRFRVLDHLRSRDRWETAALLTAAQPSPLRAETLNQGRFQRNVRRIFWMPRIGVRHGVDLVEHQPARLALEALAVFLQLRGDHADVPRGVRFGEINHVQQQAGAREVAQELVAEAGALGGALDQPGDVGEHEARLADAHHAERRIEGGERVVGDLRARARHRADEARLAGVRQAEQADVGEHAQLEREPAALARLAAGELARRAVDARLEVHVAEAALAAAREQRALAVPGEVGDQIAGFLVADHGAHRHAQLEVAPGGAVAVLAQAAGAVLGAVDAREAVVDQRVDVAVGPRPDAAAAAAVAAVGPAVPDVLLAAKVRGAVAALAGVHLDLRFVDELHVVEIKKPYRSR